MQYSNPVTPLKVDSHPRLSEYRKLVYPVYSRRAGGLSLGINLNPDKKCNFRCVYCQVDRTPGTKIDFEPTLEQVLEELGFWLEQLKNNQWLFQGHKLKDIAIAGDGEPTMVGFLPLLLKELLRLKKEYQLQDCPLVLFTNGTYLNRKDLLDVWPIFFKESGRIWFKLDFWDENSLRTINRTKFTAQQILNNLEAVGKKYPIILQSCFFQWRENEFNEDNYSGYVQLIQNLLLMGVKIESILAYTLARTPEEKDAVPWDEEIMVRLGNYLKERIQTKILVYNSQA